MNFTSHGLKSICRITLQINLCYKNRALTPRIYLNIGQPNEMQLRWNGTIQFAKTERIRCRHPWTFWIPARYKSKEARDFPILHRDLEFPNFDFYRKKKYVDVNKTKWDEKEEKAGFTYVVGFFGLMGGFYSLKTCLTHFALYMGAAADVLALAQVELEIGNILPGQCASFKWRGKPLFIKHRTQSEIDVENKTPLNLLRDPETEEQRMINPRWLIVIGVCTHLGCIPIANSGDWAGGFYCPCHGSHYDNMGRTRKGPAPTNLVVPPVKFLDDTHVLVG